MIPVMTQRPPFADAKSRGAGAGRFPTAAARPTDIRHTGVRQGARGFPMSSDRNANQQQATPSTARDDGHVYPARGSPVPRENAAGPHIVTGRPSGQIPWGQGAHPIQSTAGGMQTGSKYEAPPETRDITTEAPLSFAAAGRAVSEIDGRPVAPSTIWRWATKGIGGTRLECIRIGRRMRTSRAALSRFFHRLGDTPAERRSTPAGAGGRTPTPPSRTRAIEAAIDALNEAGI
jgi:hypothetical protein